VLFLAETAPPEDVLPPLVDLHHGRRVLGTVAVTTAVVAATMVTTGAFVVYTGELCFLGCGQDQTCKGNPELTWLTINPAG
jgi:hypothetical protein